MKDLHLRLVPCTAALFHCLIRVVDLLGTLASKDSWTLALHQVTRVLLLDASVSQALHHEAHGISDMVHANSSKRA